MILEETDSEILLHIHSNAYGVKTARIDLADKALVLSGRWWLDRGRNETFYVKGVIGGTRIPLHRAITNCPRDMVVDHIDGDGLNCKRVNLRTCSKKDNSRNSFPNKGKDFKGVYKPKRGRWVAQIVVDGKWFYLGRHDTKEEALIAYDRAALEKFGKFARINIGGNNAKRP